ncbi:MAG: thiamine pyrophosphate-binding protein [Deltaproteobacteria bacterium]|nr:thiamine pyrophosphate-binding protein [Deltaproteobacteria bacterium]
MRSLVMDYLKQDLSRRGFLKAMAAAGFTVAAAESVLKSLAPLAHADTVGKTYVKPFEGNGGALLAEQLLATGAEYLFVGNGSGLGALCDAVIERPKLKLVLATHEAHVVAMASGYAMASGKTVFCMYSRVGAAHSTGNMYNAMKDRLPIVIAVDRADTTEDGRDGHEDLEDMLEPVKQYTKWRWVVKEVTRIPEWVTKAFKVSSTLPCGPTYMMMPRDVMFEHQGKANIFQPGTFDVPMNVRPNAKAVEKTAKMLLEAKTPLLLLGPEVYQSNAQKEVVELAEMLGLPVCERGRWCQVFPNQNPLFLGPLRNQMRYPQNVDLLLNLGALFPNADETFIVKQKVPTVVAGTDVRHMGDALPLENALVGNLKEATRDLIDAIKSIATKDRIEKIAKPRLEETKKFTDRLRAGREAAAKRVWDQKPIEWDRLAKEIEEVADKDAIVVEEFGSQRNKCLDYLSLGYGAKTQLGRTTGSCLGWGLPAAVGVKLAKPDHQVWAFQGDGGMLFGQTEALWPMRRHEAPVITVIFNNRSYNETRNRMWGRGKIQREQKKDMISHLGNPDVSFAKIAEAYDIKGEVVADPNDIKPALKRAIQATRDGRPYLLDVLVAQAGQGANLNWYPKVSVAEMRTKKV